MLQPDFVTKKQPTANLESKKGLLKINTSTPHESRSTIRTSSRSAIKKNIVLHRLLYQVRQNLDSALASRSLQDLTVQGERSISSFSNLRSQSKQLANNPHPTYLYSTAMVDTDPQIKRLLLPTEETLFEQLLRIGLYLGAVFQIICLLAIVVYQAGPSDGVTALKDDPSDVECSENSPQVTPRRPHRLRKQEKKKRR
ncbi:uncharacterized protein LOC107225636 isoform X1 [Neodiprion lecontei]|uniref:Uncharacterized protein LOC107225636 isoform X1 n=2 Tax=Neodiprion lecontei TaxID=441921 RepID=A0ABM3G316_NEOLC|nr:uncharacterized protein LOC107225636 isoform X1 [Neodiprion lecontei]